MSKNSILAGVLAFALVGQSNAGELDFAPGPVAGPLPWTHENFDSDPQKFTFAIHSDLTGGERPEIFATAMAQLALLRPEFLISVGDLIDGGGDRDELIGEWESYDARIEGARFPVLYVSGNHDVSSELERELWGERYGPIYYHFRYRDVLFLVLDSEDMTSERRVELVKQRLDAIEIHKTQGAEAALTTPYGQSAEKQSGAISEAQADYFVKVLADNSDARHTFLFVHKPVWEASSSPYARIEGTLKARPFTAFNGHVHAYAYTQRMGRDHIQLATTGGGFFPDLGMSEDHVTLVTVGGEDEVSIANLMLAGIRDKTGAIPNNGDALCFSAAACESK
ncbi:metallophosphoesterase family protein [Parasedimentitalea psychrophila]|uniref:Metallophosphoesterase n=1 Tax=Parasedimentitalea psychrophila TaxID=2997337 RepID=A0A9Y2P0T2_9RHOB|nr:metallophosphoesterase [Parasedimentitalea psychrophila]WIY23462.1 metallophosphoesterase [Parasedimentitalea psychrophila]